MTRNDLGGRRTTDFSRSPVSRYIQLATLFRNRIASGEWPVGSRIPNVDELAAAFAVARGTMREALGYSSRRDCWSGCVRRARSCVSRRSRRCSTGLRSTGSH